MTLFLASIPILILAAGLAPPESAALSQPQPVVGTRPNALGPGGVAAAMIPGSRPLIGADLERVTMGGGDMNNLGTEGRVPQANLRVSNDFASLYRIPTTARTRYAGWYAREQGGVMAVFPQSLYTRDGDGNIITEVPPGTIFMVGGIPQDDSHRADTMRQENTLVTRREDTSINAPNTNARPANLPPSRRIVAMTPMQLAVVQQSTIEALVNDEAFAAKRITQRLEQALAGKPVPESPAESPNTASAPTAIQPSAPATKPASAPLAAPPAASGWKRSPAPEKPESAAVPAPAPAAPQPAKPESK